MKLEIVENSALQASNLEAATQLLSALPHNTINNVNWPVQYPYKPSVAFTAAYNDNYLFIHFSVDEQSTRAKAAVDGGDVWCDSCVEFFFSPDTKCYYNFEFNCIGTMLLGFRNGTESERATSDVMQHVKRYTTLEAVPFDEKMGQTHWELTVAIPATALYKHNFQTWKGVTGTANFYKCGDDLSQPHFISWNPIHFEKPNFHLPEFFGEFKCI
ncbi:MAG: carbohydrate-binding family 9-like protein [Marinifilaceae bacterium]